MATTFETAKGRVHIEATGRAVVAYFGRGREGWRGSYRALCADGHRVIALVFEASEREEWPVYAEHCGLRVELQTGAASEQVRAINAIEQAVRLAFPRSSSTDLKIGGSR